MRKLTTKRVYFKSEPDEIAIINASDFNPEIHVAADEPLAAPYKPITPSPVIGLTGADAYDPGKLQAEANRIEDELRKQQAAREAELKKAVAPRGRPRARVAADTLKQE